MKALRVFVCLGVSLLSFAAATPALGLANRVFVSARSGNNANSCDNINTPRQTLQGAVSQLNPRGSSVAISVDQCRFEQNATTGFTAEASVPITGIISNSVFFAGGQGINFQSPDIVSAHLTVDRWTITTNVNEGVRGVG